MRCIYNKKIKNERGSATIEALISFTGFLFVIFTILNIVNFCRVQMLISNAIDTTTKELSQYSYFYEMSGLQKFSKDIADNSAIGANNINDVIGTVDNLYSSLGSVIDNTAEHLTNVQNAVEEGNSVMDSVQNALVGIKNDGTNIETSMNAVMSAFDTVQDNPLLYMKSIVAVAGNEALNLLKSHIIAAPLAKLFTAKHFGATVSEADECLKNLGVVDGIEGMNFKMSTIFSSNEPEDVHIVVYYKLRITQIFGWVTLEVPMCKESVARAWLGGDDVILKVEPVTSASETDNEEETNDETEPESSTEEESNDDNIEEVNIEGSYWHLPEKDEWNFNPKQKAFIDLMMTSKGITQDTAAMYMYGRDKNNHAYGVTYCVDKSNASYIAIEAFSMSYEMIEEKEKQYIESEGAYGYEPGTTTDYTYIVYVPENISDETLSDIKNEVTKELYIPYKESSENKTGLKLNVTIEYVKAGGNYDYRTRGNNQ